MTACCCLSFTPVFVCLLTVWPFKKQWFVSFRLFMRSGATPRNAKWPHGRSNLQLWSLDSSSAFCLSDVKITATCAQFLSLFPYKPNCFIKRGDVAQIKVDFCLIVFTHWRASVPHGLQLICKQKAHVGELEVCRFESLSTDILFYYFFFF